MKYDGRGFLLEEKHPEKAGKVCYKDYDAGGHAGRKVDPASAACGSIGANGQRDLLFTYDRAERLEEIREGGTGGRPLKELEYETAGIAGWSKGKLRVAKRHNHHGAPFNTDVLVTETYTYAGVEGRVSARTTDVFVGAESIPEVGPLTGFTQTFAYDRLGRSSALGYPECATGWCASEPGPLPRTVNATYAKGLLTGVTGFATSLTYHENGALATVAHANGVTDSLARDPNWMLRPASITTANVAGGLDWSSGTFTYDGAGNVEGIGADRFRYDQVSRLAEARVHAIPGQGGEEFRQAYTFDAFGNLTEIEDYSGLALDTDPVTNRLVSGAYDAAGNLTAWNGHSYEYDRLNVMLRRVTPGAASQDWRFIYTADDERVWAYRVGGAESRFAVRDLGGRVLRDYSAAFPEGFLFADGFESGDTSAWDLPATALLAANDYVYRDGALLAAAGTRDGTRHFHLDHLGSPRLTTGGVAERLAQHTYLPFGEEIPPVDQDQERMKFTGHERDLADPAGVGDDLDYMRARMCSPVTGRFLSVDPLQIERSASLTPQRWNRYAYVLGNPLRLVDPTGALAVLTGDVEKTLRALRGTVPPELRKLIQAKKVGGKTVLDTRLLNSLKTTAGNFGRLRQIANSPGTVAVTTSESTFSFRSGSGVSSESFQGSSLGVTLPPSSSLSGSTEVYVNPDLAALDTAATTAHEMVHANRLLLGLPWQDELAMVEESPNVFTVTLDPNSPITHLTRAAEAEAEQYFDPFSIPLE